MSAGKGLMHLDMNRRQALGVIGGALAACATGLNRPALASETKRPNVIFILVDDQRWDHMGNMGHPFLKTPSMDRLAREGVRFDNAFVTTSLCSPSRASFLTGQYAHTHGVKNNLTPWSNDNETYLEHFKKAGYDTAFIGKWHMPGKLPELRGVDKFITFTAQAGQGQYFDCPLIVDGKEEPSGKKYITEELTDRALEYLEERKDKPFCLYLSHKAVHHPFLPPSDLDKLYENEKLPLPDEYDSWVSWFNGLVFSGVLGPLERDYRNYCEALVSVDRQVGRVLDWLDKNGLAEDTIVVYAGDNGYFWGEHRLVDKRWPYEESIRVPLIVRHPRSVANAGQSAPQMALNLDVAPTIMEMAGLPIPEKMEGQSLAPVLKDRNAPGRKAWLYEYFKDFPYNVPELKAVRTDRYKYVKYEGKRPDELFDLKNDPREKHNLMGTEEGKKVLPLLASMLDDLNKGVKL